jgi:hypothetical protein
MNFEKLGGQCKLEVKSGFERNAAGGYNRPALDIKGQLVMAGHIWKG